MHGKFQTLLVFAVVALSFASGPAWAADFTFTVPVELSNLPPDSRMGQVSCLLLTRPVRAGGLGTLAGTARGTFAISGGAFRGEVTATGDANPGVDPATITNYSCGFGFTATLRGRDQTFLYGMWAGTSTLPLAPGAPFIPRVDGTIP
jgi:hypothetical protein